MDRQVVSKFRVVDPSNPADFPTYRKADELERTQKDRRGKPINPMPVHRPKKLR